MVFSEFNPQIEYRMLRDKEHREGKDPEAERTFFDTRLKQRIGIAKLGGLLIEKAMENPHISEQELTQHIHKHKQETLLADYQQSIFKKIIKEFIKRRKKMERIAPKDTAPETLCETLWKIKPAHPVRIHYGTFCLHIILHDDDYSTIIKEKKISPMAKRPEGISDGRYFLPPKHSGIISIGRSKKGIYKGEEIEEDIRIHEETHALFSMMTSPTKYMDVFDSCYADPPTEKSIRRLFAYMSETHSRAAKEKSIYIFWNQYFINKSESIKDEIFAYLRENTYEHRHISKTLTTPKKDGGLYDYLHQARTNTLEAAHKELTPEAYDIFEEQTTLFFSEIYKKRIDDALHVVKNLQKKYNFTIEQVMIFLLDVPLDQWTRELHPQQ